MPTSISLGNIISTLRNQLDLTQEQLAKRANLHRITISDIERDVISPSFENLKNIAKALNVEIYELFSPIAERKSYKIHQPLNGTLGYHLISELKYGNYKRLFITTAYAKASGVLRLKHALQQFKSTGGEIHCFIGIDQYNTTYEALKELYVLSDKLYIIHNERLSHTYHPKVYMLDNNTENPQKVWLSIGSNNLTAGGLFINYESCSIDILNISNKYDNKSYNDTLDLFNRYSNNSNPISIFINSENIIEELFLQNYIKTEKQSIITSIKESSKKIKTPIFGYESFKAPNIEITEKIDTPINPLKDDSKLKSLSNQKNLSKLESTMSNLYSEEIFWFEMRKSTGGSRNILDLSSTGKMRAGSVLNTNYYIDDSNIIHGGVKFFDIDSNNHDIIKDIIITYNENEYFPSTILYAPNNKSWRLQLKGDSVTDTKLLSQYGISDFLNNILVFHKISTSHYLLEVVNSSQLNNLISSSVFWATNGSSKTSKAYGKLK